MFNDDKVRICSGRLEPGSTIGYHKHKQNSEVVFVLSGKLIGKFDDEVEEVSAGQIHYCPMGHSHGFRNASETEIAEILCVVPEHHVVE